MLDTIVYLILLALGFAGGYGVREYMSRRRHRRAREHAGSFQSFLVLILAHGHLQSPPDHRKKDKIVRPIRMKPRPKVRPAGSNSVSIKGGTKNSSFHSAEKRRQKPPVLRLRRLI